MNDLQHTDEWWSGYQEALNDILTKKFIDKDGRQVGALVKPAPNAVGEYILMIFGEEQDLTNNLVITTSAKATRSQA